MSKPIIFLSLLTLFLSGCNDDEVKQISKEGAVETVLSVDHLDAKHDILTTTHQVWVKNALVKKVVYKDTIPSLGTSTQEATNNDGVTQSVDLKTDYEVYITVK